MSAGGARRGRRDNGLDAAEYAVAGDVDPRVGEHLLDVLAAGGIAAYLQPASDLNPITRTTSLPSRPTDRLYVDRTHLSTARQYLVRLAAEEEQAGRAGRVPDIEAEWARIVAGFHTEVDPADRPWPAAENLDPVAERSDPATERSDPTADPPTAQRPDPTAAPTAEPPARPTPRERPGRAAKIGHGTAEATPADEPSLLDALDTFGADLPGEPTDDEGYTPPPPPPLPRVSKYAVAGVLAIIAGFVLFLFPGLVPPVDSDVVMLFGFTCVLAGFVTLVWRLRPGDDDDIDPENGAVV